jgi:hypothetical protein
MQEELRRVYKIYTCVPIKIGALILKLGVKDFGHY